MIRSSLIVLGSVIALSLGFAPGKAEAAGDIQLDCWDRTDQPITITRPISTVGCTLSWFPVPPDRGAQKVMWEVDFVCPEPGCQVFGNPGRMFLSIVDPPAATRHEYIAANCTGSSKIVAVISRVVSYFERHKVVVIRERLNDEAGGFVSATPGPPECPFVGGGVGVGG